jgi:hypothetical protein
VDDAGIGRNHPKILEGTLSPAQKLIALPIPLIIEIHVGLECLGRPEGVHLDGMVHDQLDRLQRIDPAGIPSEVRHGIPHGGKVYHCGDAGKILEQHARRCERDLTRRTGRGPARQGLYIVGGDNDPIFSAKKVLEEDSQRERQPLHIEAGAGQSVEAENFKCIVSDLES